MKILILTPQPPPFAGYHFFFVGVGDSKISGPNFGYPQPGPPGPLPVRTFQVGVRRLKIFKTFDFFRNPYVAFGISLGDHLVTIWVI